MSSTIEEGGGVYLTYAEIGHRFGKSRGAAEHLVRRKKWRKQTQNHPHDLARFWVPEADLAPPPAEAPIEERAVSMLGRAWEALFEEAAQGRIRRVELEGQLAVARDELANALHDNVELRAALAQLMPLERERRGWGWWKRLAWAMHPYELKPLCAGPGNGQGPIQAPPEPSSG